MLQIKQDKSHKSKLSNLYNLCKQSIVLIIRSNRFLNRKSNLKNKIISSHKNKS